MNRPRTYTIAAILNGLISLIGIILLVPLLTAGQSAIDQAQATPPFFIILLGGFTAVLGLASSYGVWKVQRWGVILTIILRALDVLSAAPGLLFAPDMTWRLMAVVGVVSGILVIALLLWPQPRAAPAAGRAVN
ncbi:MAG TPA: hypothetical protein PKA05_01240 [Roseiflexaceae bacterium]|nr:hypothetical protein [Roseiflexaceae bacterium]HMP38981.1 hypothetical protein [Roseiflexaceae bacterium]